MPKKIELKIRLICLERLPLFSIDPLAVVYYEAEG